MMQLNLYDVVTNKLVKTLYFDDGVDKNNGRVHVTCISALDADKGQFFFFIRHLVLTSDKWLPLLQLINSVITTLVW